MLARGVRRDPARRPCPRPRRSPRPARSPPPSSTGSARRRQRNGAVRLRSSIRCQSSSVVLTSGADIEAPAFTTRISTGPHSRLDPARTRPRGQPGRAGRPVRRAPRRAATPPPPRAPARRGRPARPGAPASDRARAHAAPMPFEAPVTSAITTPAPGAGRRRIPHLSGEFVEGNFGQQVTSSPPEREFERRSVNGMPGAGQLRGDREQVHLLGALVGHHGLEVVHVAHHGVVEGDAGAAEGRPGLARDVDGGAGVGVLGVGDLGRRRACRRP